MPRYWKLQNCNLWGPSKRGLLIVMFIKRSTPIQLTTRILPCHCSKLNLLRRYYTTVNDYEEHHTGAIAGNEAGHPTDSNPRQRPVKRKFARPYYRKIIPSDKPIRTLLYVPGSSKKMLEKAWTLTPDNIVPQICCFF